MRLWRLERAFVTTPSSIRDIYFFPALPTALVAPPLPPPCHGSEVHLQFPPCILHRHPLHNGVTERIGSEKREKEREMDRGEGWREGEGQEREEKSEQACGRWSVSFLRRVLVGVAQRWNGKLLCSVGLWSSWSGVRRACERGRERKGAGANGGHGRTHTRIRSCTCIVIQNGEREGKQEGGTKEGRKEGKEREERSQCVSVLNSAFRW